MSGPAWYRQDIARLWLDGLADLTEGDTDE